MLRSLKKFIAPNLICFLVFYNHLPAAFEHQPANPSEIAAGLISINTQANPLSIVNDPASIVQFNSISAGIAWGNRFQMDPLRHQSAAVAGFVWGWPAAVGISMFGDELYNESIWSIATGRRITARMDIGGVLNYYTLVIKGYGHSSSIGLNIGWRFKLEDQLVWFGSLNNFNGATIGRTNDPLPQVLSTGLWYSPQEELNCVIEWTQDTIYESRIKFSGQFLILPWFGVYVGYASVPGQFTGGLNIDYKYTKIFYAFTTHPHLAVSHWLGLGLSIR